MARQPKLTADLLAQVGQLTRDLSLFTDPTPEQRKAKERYWAPFMAGEASVSPNSDLATALKFGADKRIRQWWDLPGFQDWFLNREEFKERIEFIAHLALDGIEEVLRDRMATASAKVAAAKLALEVANKLPKQKADPDKFADEQLNQMDRVQLEAFIKKKLSLVGPDPAKDLTIEAETVSISQEPVVLK